MGISCGGMSLRSIEPRFAALLRMLTSIATCPVRTLCLPTSPYHYARRQNREELLRLLWWPDIFLRHFKMQLRAAMLRRLPAFWRLERNRSSKTTLEMVPWVLLHVRV